MSKVQTLRAFVQQRLSAAAEEIFELFERTIAEYEEELCGQRKLLDAVFKPEVRLHRADVQLLLVSKEEVPPEQQESSPSLDQEDPPEHPHIKEEWSPSLDQEDPPEPPHIKEERSPSLDQEDPPEPPQIKKEWSPSLDQEDPAEPPYIKEEKEGDQLRGLEEADKFTFTPVAVKSEEDDEETPQSSQLHQRLTEQMKRNPDGEDCGPEPARNSDPERHLQPATDDKMSHSSETDDSCDWEETRKPQSGSKPLQSGCNTDEKPFGCSECGKQFSHNSTLRRHMRFHTIEKPLSSFSSKRFIQRVSLTHHMTLRKGEKHRQDCGGPEPVRNSDPEGHLQPATGDKTSRFTKPETDLEETREPQSGSNPLPNNEVSERDQECSTVKTSSSSSECASSFGQKRHLRKHNGLQKGEKPFSCSVCGKRYIWKKSLKIHMRFHSEEKGFSCSVKTTFLCRGDVEKHIRIHTEEKKRYSCSVCGKRFTRRCMVRHHQCAGRQSSHLHKTQTEENRDAEHLKAETDGEDCGGPEPARNSDPEGHLQPATGDKISHVTKPETDLEETREPQSGSNPLQNNEVSERDQECSTVETSSSSSECATSSGHKGRLQKRKRMQTVDKLFSCSVCKKSFSDKRNLSRHMKIHTGEKLFSCSVCGKTYVQKEHLRQHMAIHTGEKSYGCSLCGKTFAQKSHLRRHMAIHTGEKPFSCSICGKTFAQKSHLKPHMAIHTGEKPFSCSICGKAFARAAHLQPHMAIHTGEKPFSCSLCDKTFTQKSHLRPHMAIHTGEKPFSCSLCDKTFAQKSHLRPHMAIHTGRKAVSCSVCGKTFAFKTHLRQHLISHKGETL